MRLDIRRKALLFISAAGIGTSLLLGGLLLWGLDMAEQLIHSHAESIGSSVTSEAENFARDETRKRLEGTLRLQASFLDSALGEMEGDVIILAQKMTQLAKDSSQPPRQLYDPRREDVSSGQIYFLAGAGGGEPSPLARRGAAIADAMENLVRSYDITPMMLYVGSKEGWSLRMDFLADKSAVIKMPPVAMTTSYDARERVWYQAGEKAWTTGYPVYPPLFYNVENIPMLACVMAYEDEKGFAGVVGISMPPLAYQQEVQLKMSASGKLSFALNEQGQVVFSSLTEGVLAAGDPNRDLRQAENSSLAEAAEAMTAGESGSRILQVNGREYCLVYAPVGKLGWSMGQLEDLGEMQAPARVLGNQVAENLQKVQAAVYPLFPQLRMLMAFSFGLLLLLLLWVSWHWAKKFSQPIRQLADGVSGVAEGQFGKRLELHTGDEVETLAEGFNAMTDSLQTYMEDLAAVTEEKARVAAGLEVAASIQQGLLPRDFPTGRNFALYANMEPAKEVGGDFYDFYFLDERRLALTIADVSDKGVPAALFMVVARTLLKNSLMTSGDLAAAFRETNDRLAEENEESLFVTVFTAVLDIPTGKIEYVNGGHCLPLIKGQEGIRELPKSKSPMLGIGQGLDFPVNQAQLFAGDMLLLYTDGVTEAVNDKGAMFGRERLDEFLAGVSKTAAPQEMLAALQGALRQHIGEAEQFDDMTMLALRWDK